MITYTHIPPRTAGTRHPANLAPSATLLIGQGRSLHGPDTFADQATISASTAATTERQSTGRAHAQRAPKSPTCTTRTRTWTPGRRTPKTCQPTSPTRPPATQLPSPPTPQRRAQDTTLQGPASEHQRPPAHRPAPPAHWNPPLRGLRAAKTHAEYPPSGSGRRSPKNTRPSPCTTRRTGHARKGP